MLCTHDGMLKYIIMLKATRRQHYQEKAFPSHSPLVYLFLSRCQNLASSTERLSFALMLGRHPVPACLLSLPVSTGILYTRLPACQDMLCLLSTPTPLPPPAGESPVLGLLQDPGVRQSCSFSLCCIDGLCSAVHCEVHYRKRGALQEEWRAALKRHLYNPFVMSGYTGNKRKTCMVLVPAWPKLI